MKGFQELRNVYKYLNIFLLKWVNMTSKSNTLRVNTELYDQYRDFCKKKDGILSKPFKIITEEQMKGESR